MDMKYEGTRSLAVLDGAHSASPSAPLDPAESRPLEPQPFPSLRNTRDS